MIHFPLCEAFFAAKLRAMKKIISTTEAPAAIGPYSQAVRAGSLVFCAGQVPLDPKTGQIVSEDIAEQTKRVLDSVTAILKAEQLTLANVVKTTVFLADFGDFQKMNEVYATYFTENPPARSTVGVSTLPKNARVEIEAIAFDDGGNGRRKDGERYVRLMNDDLLALFRQTGALLDGHFVLRSGLHSRQFFQCALLLQHTENRRRRLRTARR